MHSLLHASPLRPGHVAPWQAAATGPDAGPWPDWLLQRLAQWALCA